MLEMATRCPYLLRYNTCFQGQVHHQRHHLQALRHRQSIRRRPDCGRHVKNGPDRQVGCLLLPYNLHHRHPFLVIYLVLVIRR
jgi:hypothetical protein